MKSLIHSTLMYKQRGFSLVEMAVVLVILGFVIGALLLPLQAQREVNFQIQTEKQLEIARTALIGFAQTKGYLPCPATAANNIDAGSYGLENPLGGTRDITPPAAVPDCVSPIGYLPAASLGIQPTDSSGFAIDAWNNRIRYAITTNDSSVTIVDGATCGGDTAPDFTTPGNMGAVGLTCLAPDLRVCTSSAVIDCTNDIHLTNNAVAVIYSSGPNGSVGGGVDEANQGVNIPPTTFYSRTPTPAGSTNGEFDDLVVWISPYVLYNAMIEAGQLH